MNIFQPETYPNTRLVISVIRSSIIPHLDSFLTPTGLPHDNPDEVVI